MTATRTLGPFQVFPVGLGGMPLSMGRPNSPVDQATATRVVAAALEAGVTLVDTADCYAPAHDQTGHNERMIGAALRELGSPGGVVVATKGGITRPSADEWGRDGSPEYLRAAVERSLTNLGVDVIDLYQWHRPDRWRIYGEVIQTFADLRAEGKIRAVGISNANVEEIEIAQQVLGEGGLASVQNEYSPRFRCSRAELDHCARHGIAFLPWSPLGGTGTSGGASDVGEQFPAFAEVAREHGVSPQQVAIAWELAASDVVVPIPGATRPESITDCAAAVELRLSEEQLARLDACR